MYEDIQRLFEQNYGLGTVASIKLLTGGLINQCFHVRVCRENDDRDYFLRVYVPEKELTEIQYEHGLMEHLKTRGFDKAGIFLPALSGKTYIRAAIQGTERFMAVQEWLDGEDIYAWTESSATVKACMNAMETIARFHACASDYVPEMGCGCKEPVIQIQLESMYKDFCTWTKELHGDHKKQHLYRYMEGALGCLKISTDSAKSLFEEQPRLPLTNIHTDTHLGNFKFSGDEVKAIFDFDWAKKDCRLYDVAMAAVTFCTSWYIDRMGQVDEEKLILCLLAYEIAMEGEASPPGRLTMDEAERLPEMMLAANLYIMRDLLRQIHVNPGLNEFEYLYYMVHQVKSLQWIQENRKKIIDICKTSMRSRRSNMDVKAIQEVIFVAKRLDEKQLVNAFEGNVSILRDGYLYITPSGKNKSTLTEEMIAVFDGDGNQVSGIYPASSELKMHRAVYGMREGIGGIVHAHPACLTAYALCNKPFESKAHAEMLWDHKRIEVAPYGRPGSDEIYKGVKPILDMGRDVLLLANHGVLAVGDTVFDAMNKLESVENAAKISVITKLIGEQADLPQDEVETLLSF